MGPNGSGKTTLLRLLRGELEPAEGSIRRADALRLVYFSQMRELDENLTLRRALAPEGDGLVYQGRDRACGELGGAVSVYQRATESAGAESERRRAGARADCQADAGAGGCAAAGRADERSGYSDAGNSGGQSAGVSGRAGAGDARSLPAESRGLDGAGAGWRGAHRAVRGLSRSGRSGLRKREQGSGRWSTRRDRRDQGSERDFGEAADAQKPSKKKLSYLEAREFAAIEQRVEES